MLRRLAPISACAVLILASGGATFAADLEPAAPLSKAPVYKAPVVSGPYNWTGFYLGANVGYGWGSADSSTNFASGVAFPGNTDADPFPALPHSDSLKLNGPNGGGQIGYNWQFTRTGVVGIEADFQANQTRSSNGFTDAFAVSDHADNQTILSGTIVTSHEAKMSWFGTVRGRLGYAMDNVLFYGTGGLAYGNVGLSGTSSSTINGVTLGAANSAFTTSAATSFAASSTNVGWTLGAGIEGAIAGNWTWKAEYLHVDLGSLTVTAGAPTGVALTAKSDFTDEIARVGVNYRFAPAVAAY
jgi:outer membrane immunogenic protein